MKEFKINELKEAPYNSGKITETGYLKRNYGPFSDVRVEINLSSIFTRLIQEAGRWCEFYASDVIFDIERIKNNAEQGNPGRFVLGFRQSGVDHAAFIKSRMENNPYNSDYYRAVWVVDITNDGEEVNVTLFKTLL